MRVPIYIALAALLVVAYLFLFPSAVSPTSAKIAIARNEAIAFSIALNNYRREYGSYPSGTNRQILDHLIGDNLRKVAFVELKPIQIGLGGELVDPWKRPYQINLVDDPKEPHVWPLGKNGVDDTANAKSDDIRSWD